MHNHAHRPPNSQSQGELNTVLDRISIRLNQSDEANPVTVRTSLTTDGGTAALNSNGAASNDSSFRGQQVHIEMNEAETARDATPSPDAEELNIMAKIGPFLFKYGIFILILLLKVLYTHRCGLLVVLSAVGLWFYLNSLLVAQISLRGHGRYKQFNWKLFCIIICSVINIASVFYWLDEDGELSDRLRFYSRGITGDKLASLWSLLWILVLNDLMVKFCTIILKSLIALTPPAMSCVTSKKKALYSVTERLTLIYRSLLPVVPWYYFLLGNSDGLLFSAILFIVYIIFKFLKLYAELNELKDALVHIFIDQPYGAPATSSQVTDVGTTCPICFDEFSNPVVVRCQHVFCESCISVWFDRQKTCPVCRSVIVTNDCPYRDGSGSPMIQFF